MATLTTTVAAASTAVSSVPTIACTVIGWLIATIFAPFGFCPAIHPTDIGICCSLTKAVVASCVEFVPCGAVGAVGVPVTAGDASGAREVIWTPLSWPFRSRR